MTEIPAHLVEAINRLVRARQRLYLEGGREPTPEELAERLAIPVERVRRMLDIAMTPVKG